MKTKILSRKLVVILALVVVATLVALTLLAFNLTTFKIFKVDGQDMEPTLHRGDRILATKERGTLQRGDIIIFRYPADPSKLFTKRIVGLPGELVEITEGKVSVNGKLLEEDYVDAKFNSYHLTKTALRIPDQSYYVLGDNRDHSNDSRMWGPLPADFIEAKVLFH